MASWEAGEGSWGVSFHERLNKGRWEEAPTSPQGDARPPPFLKGLSRGPCLSNRRERQRESRAVARIYVPYLRPVTGLCRSP